MKFKIGEKFKFRSNLQIGKRYGSIDLGGYLLEGDLTILRVDESDSTYFLANQYWVSDEMGHKEFSQSKVSLNSFLKNED